MPNTSRYRCCQLHVDQLIQLWHIPDWSGTNEQQYTKSNAFVKSPSLYRNGKHQTTKEEKVGILQNTDAYHFYDATPVYNTQSYYSISVCLSNVRNARKCVNILIPYDRAIFLVS